MAYSFSRLPTTLLFLALLQFLALLLARREKSRTNASFLLAFILGSSIVWAGGYAYELAANDLAVKLFWFKVKFAGNILLPFFFLLLTLRQIGVSAFQIKRYAITVGILYVVAIGLVATAERHGQIYQNAEIQPYFQYQLLAFQAKGGYWLLQIFSNAVGLISLAYLLRFSYQKSRKDQWQIISLWILHLAPLLSFITSQIFLPDIPLSVAPVFSGILLLIFAIAFIVQPENSALLSFRNLTFENLDNGALILNPDFVILDANPAAKKLLSDTSKQIIGIPIQRLLPQTASLLEESSDNPEKYQELIIYDGEEKRHFDFSLADLTLPDKQTRNYLLNLRETTPYRDIGEKLKQRNRELLSLQTTGYTIISNLDLAFVLDTFSWEIVNLLQVTSCAVYQWLPAMKMMEILVNLETDKEGKSTNNKGGFIAPPPTAKPILEHSRSIQYALSQKELPAEIVQYMRHAGKQSLLIVPMVHQDEILGMIEIGHDQPRLFSEEEVAMAQSLINQTAIAVANSQLYQNLQQHADQLALLTKVMQTISSSINLSETLNIITDQTSQMLQASACSIILKDEDDDCLTFVAASGEGYELIRGRNLEMGQGIMGWVAAHGQPALVHKMTQDPRYNSDVDADTGFQSESIVCEPLIVKGETIGALAAFNKQNSPFNDDDCWLLNALATPAAIAIDNARLFKKEQDGKLTLEKRVVERTEKVQAQYRRQSHIAQFETLLNKSDELQVIVDSAPAFLQSVFAAVHAGIVVFDRESQTPLLERYSFDETNLATYELYEAIKSIAIKAASLGKIRQLNIDKKANPAYYPFLAANIVNLLVAPLKERGDILGVFYVLDNKSRYYKEDDLFFAGNLAQRAAVAISRAQLYRQLQHANDELIQAAQLKDQFLANMSHELRTPLNAILGMSQVLQENIHGDLSSKQLRSLGIIEESGNHLLSLINDVLDVAKIEAGKTELDKDIARIQDICESCLRLVKQAAAKKQVKVNFSIDASSPIFVADVRRLKQILVNLLSNAIKFTPDNGQVGLEVKGEQELNRLSFTVWDTGIGISEEDIARLGSSFVQLDSSLSRRYGGTGLGLALVYRLADLHGGSVSVESELNVGSQFTVAIPWIIPEMPASKTNGISQIGLPIPSVEQRQHMKPILIAEDNPNNIELYIALLETYNLPYIVAGNGKEALAMAEKHHPSLIIMDIQMPEMDGLETIAKLRQNPKFKDLFILAVTALAMPGDRERCLQAGANAYFSKPISLSKIAETILEQLDLTPAKASAVSA